MSNDTAAPAFRTTRYKCKRDGARHPYLDVFFFDGSEQMAKALRVLYKDWQNPMSLEYFEDAYTGAGVLNGVRNLGSRDPEGTRAIAKGYALFEIPGEWGIWTMGKEVFEASYAVDNPIVKHVKYRHKFSPINRIGND